MEEQLNGMLIKKDLLEALKATGYFNKKVEDVENTETEKEIITIKEENKTLFLIENKNVNI